MATIDARDRVQLQRVLGFWALTAYGVGDILGAGIYALVGKIAGIAGPASGLAFAVSLGVAAVGVWHAGKPTGTDS